jgi:von Willebrand factor type A domain/Aerotolerance regulator N-terminal
MGFSGFNFSNLPVQFSSPLGATAWAVLAGVPVGIIALYFLKLRRRPVQVPSTLLWRRSLEDLHVNSLFQRLRKNLLLFLQVLIILLAMLALAGPRVKGSAGQGQRYILAIDNSASMSATDVAPSRLAKAKTEAKEIVSAMSSSDLAMVISFSDRARVVASYTGNRNVLLQKIEAIQPTQNTTSLRDALQVAAGLANTAKTMFADDVAKGGSETAIITPKLKIYTDGGFPDVEGFSLGNLEPEVVVIGPLPPPLSTVPDPTQTTVKPKMASDNVAILALRTRRNDEKPDEYQVFGRVHNYRADPVNTEAKLLRRDPSHPAAAGTLIDAIALMIPGQSDQAFKFDLPDPGSADLEVQLDVADALRTDNRAFTTIGTPRKAQVLAVTRGNRYLIDTLRTPSTAEMADVVIATPDKAKADPLANDMKAGRFDLVIYDQVRPDSSPAANTLYFGAIPPGKPYENSKELEGPVILDWDVAHPLMQYIRDLPTVAILKAIGVKPPTGSTVLIDSNLGPIAFVAPREGYSDTVITFGLIDEKGNFNTNWYNKYSFPLFLFNSLQVLGNARSSVGDELHLPDQPVVLRAEPQVESLQMTAPDGRGSETIKRTPQGTFVYNRANSTGIYHARWDTAGLLGFAVNLFDARESDLAPRGFVPPGVPDTQADSYRIKIGFNPVASSRRTIPVRQDWWKPIALAALGVVLLEWYIYNRRVYI